MPAGSGCMNEQPQQQGVKRYQMAAQQRYHALPRLSAGQHARCAVVCRMDLVGCWCNMPWAATGSFNVLHPHCACSIHPSPHPLRPHSSPPNPAGLLHAAHAGPALPG